MALLLLVLGLAAKEPGESGLATDALIAAIADARVDGRKLGETLGSLLTTGIVKTSRWAKTLASAARVSPLHAQVVCLAIQYALCGNPSQPPRNLLALLELLAELLSECGESVSVPAARDFLGRLTGGGKVPKLVGGLLTLAQKPNECYRRSVAVQALAARLQRAERWAACLKSAR